MNGWAGCAAHLAAGVCLQQGSGFRPPGCVSCCCYCADGVLAMVMGMGGGMSAVHWPAGVRQARRVKAVSEALGRRALY